MRKGKSEQSQISFFYLKQQVQIIIHVKAPIMLLGAGMAPFQFAR